MYSLVIIKSPKFTNVNDRFLTNTFPLKVLLFATTFILSSVTYTYKLPFFMIEKEYPSEYTKLVK